MKLAIFFGLLAAADDLGSLPAHKAYRERPVHMTADGKQVQTPAASGRRRLTVDEPTLPVPFITEIWTTDPPTYIPTTPPTTIPTTFDVVTSTETPCPVTLDVLFLQDITGSYYNLLPVFKDQVPEIVNDIGWEYPGSHFALGSFKDIPIPELGEPDDICLEQNLAFTPKADDLVAAYSSLAAQGGWDIPEFQYGALMYSALDDALGWRGTKDGDVTVAKVMIMITDADPHLAGESGLEANPGTLPLECSKWDYPSIKQVGDAMKARNIVPAFVLPAADAALADVYREFIEIALGPGMGAVVALGDGPKALIAAVDEAIHNAVEISCDINPQGCKVRENIVSRDLSHSTADDIHLFHDWVNLNLGSAPEVNKVMFVSHTDKPVDPFGYEISMDYCYWKHTDLVDWASFWLVYQIEEDKTRSGGDFAENQLDSVIQALTDVQWLTEKDDDCRCVYILTDAFFHEAGDFIGAPAYDPSGPECETGDYPSVFQLAVPLEGNTKCLHVVTDALVESYWTDLEADLRAAGYTGTYTVEILPKSPKTGRKLRASAMMQHFVPQEPRVLEAESRI